MSEFVLFNALRWIIRAGAPWRMMPHDFPRWEAVCPFAHLQISNRDGG
jgi:transposase